MSVIVYQFQTVRFIQMMSLTIGLFYSGERFRAFRPSCLGALVRALDKGEYLVMIRDNFC